MEREKLQSCDWPMDVWLPDWSQAPPTCTGLTGHQPPLSFNCLCCTFTWISLPSTLMPIGNGEALIHWTHLALSMRPPRCSAGRRGPGCDNGGGRVNYTHYKHCQAVSIIFTWRAGVTAVTLSAAVWAQKSCWESEMFLRSLAYK